jgi:hypothetical protein
MTAIEYRLYVYLTRDGGPMLGCVNKDDHVLPPEELQNFPMFLGWVHDTWQKVEVQYEIKNHDN